MVFYINLNHSKTSGTNSRTHVASCSLTDQSLTWLFAIGCETIRLKHATLLAKLPINANNTSWGVAWMKCKGAVFLQRSTNTDETLLRGLFAWSIAETNRNILGQDGVLCNNAMVLTERLALWLVGMRSQVEGPRFWYVGLQQVTVSAAHKIVNITFIAISECIYKKSLAGKPLLVTKHFHVCMRIQIFTLRSASWLKLKSSHFRKCCKENLYLCGRRMQNHMEIFSTTANVFIWRLRLRAQKAQSLHYWRMGGKNLKSVNQYRYLGAVLDTELPDDKDIQTQPR